MKILITGANGFVSKNLAFAIAERTAHETLEFTRAQDQTHLPALVEQADFIYHLAGVNRPTDPGEFDTGNSGLTDALCRAIETSGRAIPIVFASSTQAMLDNAYGRSKLAAEQRLRAMAAETGSHLHIYRLPNVFGKWCRPNYNSVVATFCHNIARDLPVRIDNPDAPLTLVYIDDVVASFLACLNPSSIDAEFCDVEPQYRTTVGELADQLRSFHASRDTLVTERVGTGLTRALYATYVSELPPAAFSYKVPQYGDARGVFVEMLKTPDAGQFSFFTAHPNITRGGHYHHTKTEKFLVIKGKARFGFRHMITGEFYSLTTSGEHPEIVESVPGWTHDITNIGDEEMIVMLWANEIFDRARPDTIACPVEHESP